MKEKGGYHEIVIRQDCWMRDSGWNDIRNLAASRLWEKRYR
jgi:hypothetical protein